MILTMREEGIRPEIRQMVGLTLKSQIEKNFIRIAMETLNYIKEKLMIAFYDPEQAVRKSVSSAMSTIIVKGGYYAWP